MHVNRSAFVPPPKVASAVVHVVPSQAPEGITAAAIGFRTAEDGKTLVRGARGDEVIYKMPKEKYDAIQKAKAEANTRAMRSGTAARDDVANAAGSSLGDEAGSYIQQHGNITIRDSVTRER